MENISYLPNISNWEKIGNELVHELTNLTIKQRLILNKFVQKHNNFYICHRKNKLLICKRELILM